MTVYTIANFSTTKGSGTATFLPVKKEKAEASNKLDVAHNDNDKSITIDLYQKELPIKKDKYFYYNPPTINDFSATGNIPDIIKNINFVIPKTTDKGSTSPVYVVSTIKKRLFPIDQVLIDSEKKCIFSKNSKINNVKKDSSAPDPQVKSSTMGNNSNVAIPASTPIFSTDSSNPTSSNSSSNHRQRLHSTTYFTHYLFHTPYVRPQAAYRQAQEIDNRHGLHSNSTLANQYRQYNHYAVQLSVFSWKVPIPGLWTLLSFIPFTSQQKQRIAFAKKIQDYREAIAYNLRHKTSEEKNGEEIADIQRLNPWSTGTKHDNKTHKSIHASQSLNTPPALLQQRILNVLYRLGIYTGLVLSIAVITATFVVLMATGVFGPAAATLISGLGLTALANVLAMALPASLPLLITLLATSVTTSLLTLQEICFPGSLARAFAKALTQLVKPHSLLTKSLGEPAPNSPTTSLSVLTKIMNAFMRYLVKPLVAGAFFNLIIFSPFSIFTFRRYIDELRQGESFPDKILKDSVVALRDFIPTSDLSDYAILRTFLNPIQLAQMTLTWLTLTLFMCTDYIGGIGGPFRWVNNIFQSATYTLYAGLFLLLEPFKQLTGALIARPIDNTMHSIWMTLHTSNKQSAKNLISNNDDDLDTEEEKTPITKALKRFLLDIWENWTMKIFPRQFSGIETNENDELEDLLANSDDNEHPTVTPALNPQQKNNHENKKTDIKKSKLTSQFNSSHKNINDNGGMINWIKSKLTIKKTSTLTT
ncbi:MAG: hypothetical protein ACX932_03820 [Gammaproteobacteria bacterium]